MYISGTYWDSIETQSIKIRNSLRLNGDYSFFSVSAGFILAALR